MGQYDTYMPRPTKRKYNIHTYLAYQGAMSTKYKKMKYAYIGATS